MCFCSFNNSPLWVEYLRRCAAGIGQPGLETGIEQPGLDGGSSTGACVNGLNAELLPHWSAACLGRFAGTARLCPGKMALEEQCSAPPRWRSISLTHVEFPEGM